MIRELAIHRNAPALRAALKSVNRLPEVLLDLWLTRVERGSIREEMLAIISAVLEQVEGPSGTSATPGWPR